MTFRKGDRVSVHEFTGSPTGVVEDVDDAGTCLVKLDDDRRRWVRGDGMTPLDSGNVDAAATPSPLKDSGDRESFASGAVRDVRGGKGRFDLLSPIALRRLAVHTENGATKYAARNWEQGMPLCRFLDSAIRHLTTFQEGHRDEDHLAAAFWNIGALIHTEEMVRRGLLPAELNDLPSYVPKGGDA